MARAEDLLASRRGLPQPADYTRKDAEEGGCGVIGMASTLPIEGKHIFTACGQMRNRGNGKGGGICAVGLDPKALGVSREILENDYLLQIAYLDEKAREDLEDQWVFPPFEVHHQNAVATLDDFKQVPGLEVKPPAVFQYFVRVKPAALDAFIQEKNLGELERTEAEDEFIYQHSYRFNHANYASLGDKKAFVESHGKNLVVFKLVGYAEDAVRYYKLDEFKAHIWIGHQRYPTKGRVWHPGGAHPFIGLHEALVHNGDFANYARVTKYLKQRHIVPLFLTDTEVSVQLFDLWTRVYKYPLEYTIEAMAPTTERDFAMLPPEKQKVYRAIQSASMKASPDGPWFFIIARSDPRKKEMQLMGITDTSMLRPQVFALQDTGLRPPPSAQSGEEAAQVREADSTWEGMPVPPPMPEPPAPPRAKIALIASEKQAIDAALESLQGAGYPYRPPADLYWNARGGSYTDGGAFVFTLPYVGDDLTVTDKFGRKIAPERPDYAVTVSHRQNEDLKARIKTQAKQVLDFQNRGKLGGPSTHRDHLAFDATDFPQQGAEALNMYIASAFRLGWKRITAYNLRGHRFLGCGLGPGAQGRLDIYGSSGDYLASGLDGAEIRVHGNAQDQVGQILKSGKLVIYGDVGQAFMYAAKGGEVFVLGNAAGRPLINAVGKPKVVINGTALDYLAESFMAGDPMKGGGFIVLNGIRMTGRGEFQELETPFPGGNLFSLASGGALYVRDPEHKVGDDQLNGGKLGYISNDDWDLFRPLLVENERLFGIKVQDLLTHKGQVYPAKAIYRKISPTALRALIMAHD